MRSISKNDLDKIPGKQLKANEIFTFRCHSGLACFNRCCHNLNLFLYPYDVLRLKNAIGLDSDTFLDRYVDIVLRDGNYFPDVLLKMSEDQQRSCCYLTPKGCKVYLDRPDACRSFPIEKGMIPTSKKASPQLVYFFRSPDFCMGDRESCEHTPQSWTHDQKAETYEEMTILWAKLKQRFTTDPWGGQGPNCSKGKMAFMAVYNLDRFRQFIFKSSFLTRYKVKNAILKKIQTDDRQLLLFAFDWIKLFVWSQPSKMIRPRS
jgi:Fe-S-cluster containining protein